MVMRILSTSITIMIITVIVTVVIVNISDLVNIIIHYFVVPAIAKHHDH